MSGNQSHQLIEELSHWLELFDENFSEDEVPLHSRPLQATIRLFREGAISIRVGGAALDVSALTEHIDSDWFRALYCEVEQWYAQRFGVNRLKKLEGRHLAGAVLIHGVAFGLKIRALRTKIEVSGESAWMYFEDGIGEGEDPLGWIIDSPNLKNSDDDLKGRLISDVTEVASSLRFIQFRSNLGDFGNNKEAQELSLSSLSYLQNASRRMISDAPTDRSLAWWDLQMANETALKSVIRRATNQQKFIHSLPVLLEEAKKFGVSFEAGLLAEWPDFKNEISHWRYGQGHPLDLNATFCAYNTSLQLVRASMETTPSKLKPGFGILIRYPPWKPRPGSSNP